MMNNSYKNIFTLFLAAGFCGIIAINILMSLSIPHLDRVLWPWNDGDDWLNLVQARQWLAGGSFFDRTIYRTNAPFGGIETHWTGAMDIFLAPFVALAPVSWSLDQKLMVSAAVVPPLFGILCCVVLLWGARKITAAKDTFFLLAALVLFGTITQYHFLPGRVDHHPPQMAIWCLIVALCAQPPAPRRCFLIGLLLASELWISVEAIFIILGVYSLFGLASLYRPPLMKSTALMCLSTAIFSTLFLFLDVPTERIISFVAYDKISIVQIIFLYCVALAAAILAPVFVRVNGNGKRLLFSIMAAGGIILAMFATFPKFFRGPLVDTNPFIQQGLFDYITDAAPFFKSSAQNICWVITEPLLAIATLVICLSRKRKKWQDVTLAFLLALACGLMFIQIRWCYYVLPVAVFVIMTRLPLVMRLLGPHMHTSLRVFSATHKAIGTVIIATLITAISCKFFPSPYPERGEECSAEMSFLLQSGYIQEALGAQPLTLFISPDFGGLVQFFTPYRVIAGLYHREGAGLRDLHDIRTAATAGEALSLLRKRHVDVLSVCPTDFSKDSWLAALTDQTKPLPEWLRLIPLRHTTMPGEKPVLLAINRQAR